jgi:hypothetical protein
MSEHTQKSGVYQELLEISYFVAYSRIGSLVSGPVVCLGS